jgi:hypothetical protein
MTHLVKELHGANRLAPLETVAHAGLGIAERVSGRAFTGVKNGGIRKLTAGN